MALTKTQKAKIKRIIEERQAKVAAELQQDVDKTRAEQYPKLAEGPGDAADHANADLITDLDTAEVSRQVRELRHLDEALTRLSEDEFGVCSHCGVDIPFERLTAYPTAVRCIDCQRVHEKTHAHPGEPTL